MAKSSRAYRTDADPGGGTLVHIVLLYGSYPLAIFSDLAVSRHYYSQSNRCPWSGSHLRVNRRRPSMVDGVLCVQYAFVLKEGLPLTLATALSHGLRHVYHGDLLVGFTEDQASWWSAST